MKIDSHKKILKLRTIISSLFNELQTYEHNTLLNINNISLSSRKSSSNSSIKQNKNYGSIKEQRAYKEYEELQSSLHKLNIQIQNKELEILNLKKSNEQFIQIKERKEKIDKLEKDLDLQALSLSNKSIPLLLFIKPAYRR